MNKYYTLRWKPEDAATNNRNEKGEIPSSAHTEGMKGK